jgi:hypothetical protein
LIFLHAVCERASRLTSKTRERDNAVDTVEKLGKRAAMEMSTLRVKSRLR